MATAATSGANTTIATVPRMVPMEEAVVVSPSAFPPSPRIAIGYPSNAVAAAEGVPGILSRIEP
ncbi:hypothetical protein SDC9_187918 [bioreactor metagenome]|uniref:Uncharacterized protein n=1 Tax=bioreactor metagenome TaxID=1076179 RepID=A0A645HPI9_9ZZZZ